MLVAFAITSGCGCKIYKPLAAVVIFYPGHLLALVELVIVGSTLCFAMGL